jgi:hypothetical protein
MYDKTIMIQICLMKKQFIIYVFKSQNFLENAHFSQCELRVLITKPVENPN